MIESVMAVLDHGPLQKADAIVVLCGEDAEARVNMAVGLFASGGAPKIILSGKPHDGKHLLGAEFLKGRVMAKGVHPDAIVVENESANTREQAVNIARMAADHGWQRIIIVPSPYHTYRAFLTFVQALKDIGHDHKVHVVCAPASQAPWFRPPPGMNRERVALLNDELAKVEEYRAKGHVASFQDALAYQRYWEQGP